MGNAFFLRLWLEPSAGGEKPRPSTDGAPAGGGETERFQTGRGRNERPRYRRETGRRRGTQRFQTMMSHVWPVAGATEIYVYFRPRGSIRVSDRLPTACCVIAGVQRWQVNPREIRLTELAFRPLNQKTEEVLYLS